ncbi:MAG: dehydrogenase, partial [Rudanella sp.]|nr:dehydrogenase [Rudanella sp.]
MTTQRPFKLVFASVVVLSAFIAAVTITSFDESKFSLDAYKVEDGFSIKLIASETLLKAPVSMDFDNKGRMWVVQMIGYMPNLEGVGEDDPTGRISILEDVDKDGVA